MIYVNKLGTHQSETTEQRVKRFSPKVDKHQFMLGNTKCEI